MKKPFVMWYLAGVHFPHLPFKDLNSEIVGLPNSTLCFYGVVSCRCMQPLSLLTSSSEITSLKLSAENLTCTSLIILSEDEMLHAGCRALLGTAGSTLPAAKAASSSMFAPDPCQDHETRPGNGGSVVFQVCQR